MKTNFNTCLLLFLLIVLASCKSTFVEKENKTQNQQASICLLTGLKKTVNYENEIESWSKDHTNKVLNIEATQTNSAGYEVVCVLPE